MKIPIQSSLSFYDSSSSDSVRTKRKKHQRKAKLKPPQEQQGELQRLQKAAIEKAIKEEALLLVAAMKPDKKVRDREFKTAKSALEKTTLNQEAKDSIIKRVTLLKFIMETHKIAYA